MFIGRDKELNALDKLYKSDKFEFVVIYGRRRVGKTALINQFIGDKKSIYFMGVESNEKQNLENLSKSIIEFSSGIQAETSFASFQAALEYVFKLAENERIILTIDEYPYVARSSKSLASTLQLLIDKYKENPAVKEVRVFFITAPNADFDAFEKLAAKNYEIAETLNHIMNSVNFDCNTCKLKAICDEVEGMKELHFSQRNM